MHFLILPALLPVLVRANQLKDTQIFTSPITSSGATLSSWTDGLISTASSGRNEAREHRIVPRDDDVTAARDYAHKAVAQMHGVLDRNELHISPQERLIRVASAAFLAGKDEDGYVKDWAKTFAETTKDLQDLTRAFVWFAYEAKFSGSRSELMEKWILEFDDVYRNEHCLPSRNPAEDFVNEPKPEPLIPGQHSILE